MKELERYFLVQLKKQYRSTMDFFPRFTDDDFRERNLEIFQDFIARLHRKEVLQGQIREILSEMIFHIDTQYPSSLAHPLRLNKTNWIVHCQCGSTFDEVPLVQCYACQVQSIAFFSHQSFLALVMATCFLRDHQGFISTLLLFRMSSSVRRESFNLFEDKYSDPSRRPDILCRHHST